MSRWMMAGTVAVCVLALGLVGCGDSEPTSPDAEAVMAAGGEGSASNASLSEEQQAYLAQAQSQFEELQTKSQSLLEDLKAKAESPEAEKAAAALETALKDAQEVVAALRSADGGTFEEKKQAVQDALADLGSKYADALAKSKLGDVEVPDVQLPGLGN